MTMGWLMRVVILLALRSFSLSTGVLHASAMNSELGDEDISSNLNNIEEAYVPLSHLPADVATHLEEILARILIEPWPQGVNPLLYVENEHQRDDEAINRAQLSPHELSGTPYKRSKYFRKYPWKRQNSRYDSENRYLCQPSKDDVFRLLFALHDAKHGVRGSTIRFCNRRKPASMIATNMRFLGKK